jgi:simple sugar transport system permease protein
MLSPIYLVPRQQVPLWLRVSTFIGGIGLGLLIAFCILVLNGVTPGQIVNEYVVYVFLDLKGLAQVVTTSTPLLLAGLASAAALKLKFWNIGVEGQMWLGCIAATGVAIFDVGPEWMRLELMFVAAAVAGALWVAVPAFLKLRYGVNEIITTLLLTYVAFKLVEHLLFGAWQDPGSAFPNSPRYDEDSERLARLGWGSAHTGIWIALGAAAVLWFIMTRSRLGYFMDAVGANVKSAHAAGVPVLLTIGVAVALSGGLGGMAGASLTAGQEYKLTIYIAWGYTFSGILIAFIGRFRPIPVTITAFVVGGVYTAGDTLLVFYQLPRPITTLIEAVILLSLITVEFFSRYHITFGKKERAS